MTGQIRLVGDCNRCGLCCLPFGYRCINLIISKPLGEPQATKCAVYSHRWDGMPIMLLDTEGNIVGHSKCHKGCPMEIEAILEKGIGRGCSMEVQT